MATIMKLCLYLLALTLCNVDFIEAKKPIVTCYVASWASYRGNFSIKDIDTQHCTHVIYAFMGINENTSEIMSVDPLLDFEADGKGKGQLKELKALKTLNPKLKILASVGGYNQGSVKFSEMARNPVLTTSFLNSIIKFIRDWELDGIDICWQHPAQRGGRSDDRRNFKNLLKDIKRVFQPERWLLTVHIVAHLYKLEGYDVKAISEIVDYINLAAVEYHGPWDRTTGIMAPLNSSNGNSVTFMIDYILARGTIPSKILLGLPTYGHAYITEEKVQSEKYVGMVSNKAYASPWTNEPGIIAYNEICMNLKNDSGWTEGFDQDSVTPIAYKDNIFVSFDNQKSLIEKAKLVITRRLGGIMLWSIDMDDFLGLCHNKSYPMLSSITDFIISEEEKQVILKSSGLNENNPLTINLTEMVSTTNNGGNGGNKVGTVILTILISYIFYVISL